MPFDSRVEEFLVPFGEGLLFPVFGCAVFPGVRAYVSGSPNSMLQRRTTTTSERPRPRRHGLTYRIVQQEIPQDEPSEDVGDRGLPDCPPSVVLGESERAALLPSTFGASVTLIFGRAASDMA